MEKYPWYEVVDGNEPLLQGDFVKSCPIVIPNNTLSNGKTKAEIANYDVIIMSQSCDLIQRKLDFVLLCPYWTLSEWADKYPEFKSDHVKEALRRGHYFGQCILDTCNLKGYKDGKDYFVVNLKNMNLL